MSIPHQTSNNFQPFFNQTIGELDRVLSLLVNWGREADELDEPNRQTLKHHAEDMIAAGQKILKDLGEDQEGLPQPHEQTEPTDLLINSFVRIPELGITFRKGLLLTQMLPESIEQGSDYIQVSLSLRKPIDPEKNKPEGSEPSPGLREGQLTTDGVPLWIHRQSNNDVRACADDGWLDCNGWEPLTLEIVEELRAAI